MGYNTTQGVQLGIAISTITRRFVGPVLVRLEPVSLWWATLADYFHIPSNMATRVHTQLSILFGIALKCTWRVLYTTTTRVVAVTLSRSSQMSSDRTIHAGLIFCLQSCIVHTLGAWCNQLPPIKIELTLPGLYLGQMTKIHIWRCYDRRKFCTATSGMIKSHIRLWPSFYC